MPQFQDEVPFQVVRDLCERFGFDSQNVRQITFYARTRVVEVLAYALDEEGSKHLGSRGVVLEAVTFPIERIVREDEA